MSSKTKKPRQTKAVVSEPIESTETIENNVETVESIENNKLQDPLILKESIKSNSYLLDKQKNIKIANLLVNRIDPNIINKYYSESADGTRIMLDKLENLDNYTQILNEIYNIIIS